MDSNIVILMLIFVWVIVLLIIYIKIEYVFFVVTVIIEPIIRIGVQATIKAKKYLVQSMCNLYGHKPLKKTINEPYNNCWHCPRCGEWFVKNQGDFIDQHKHLNKWAK